MGLVVKMRVTINVMMKMIRTIMVMLMMIVVTLITTKTLHHQQ